MQMHRRQYTLTVVLGGLHRDLVPPEENANQPTLMLLLSIAKRGPAIRKTDRLYMK